VEHQVQRISTVLAHILTCTCGKRLMGVDEIDCYRRHQLHVLEEHQEQDARV
jgi:hypothetical protein